MSTTKKNKNPDKKVSGKPVAVLGHVEVPCYWCADGLVRKFMPIPLDQDGMVPTFIEVDDLNDADMCDACKDKDREEQNAKRRLSRQQKKWRDRGGGKLTY